MQKKILVILLLLSVAFVSGCVDNSDETDVKKEVKISGSSSGIAILVPIADEFSKKNPDIKIIFLASTSTGDGVIGVAKGTLDIGSAARLMKDSEKEEYPNLEEMTYVKDAMVLGVHPTNTVSGITSEEAKKIHSGDIADWSEVGGEKKDIVLLDREESESSKIVLRREILGPDMKISDQAVLLYSSSKTNEAIEADDNAIGQTSLGTIKMKNLKIKPLAIDGIMPSTDTVKSGEYKMVRNYGIVFQKDNVNEAAQKFIDFVFSEEATQILLGYDFVPVPRN